MANRIAERRRNAGLTQHDLAHLLKVPQARISEWERGVRTPNVYTAIRLAKALSCKVEEIFLIEESPGQA